MTDEQSRAMSPRRRRNRRRYYIHEIVSLILYILAVYVVCLLVTRYVGQKTVVDGSSMWPTLEDGDNLIVDKISYRIRDPERFDIVIFRYLYLDDCYYIKRIIGLPGETVQIADGQIYINGEILEENYGSEPIINPGRAYEPVTLGEDEYFVLGDNRNLSSDSREPSVGNVARSQIIGRAVWRLYPFSAFGRIGS